MGSELPPAPPAWHRPDQRDRNNERRMWIVIVVVMAFAGLVGLWVLSGLHRETVLYPHDNLFHPHECLMWHDFRLSCNVT
jgi:hypothetical protein